VNLLQLAFHLRRRVGPLEGRRILRSAVRVFASAGAVALVVALSLATLHDSWHRGILLEGVVVALGLALAVGGGWLAMRLLKVEELAVVENLVRSLLARLRGR
jgi:peptidoglycan biosynthesis protein MviN/MurJ (putative lipid II flippase)